MSYNKALEFSSLQGNINSIYVDIALTSQYLNYFKLSLLTALCLCMLTSFGLQAAEKFNTENRYLYIQPGQSVFNIVKVLYPAQSKRWPAIIKQLVRLNPHAFIGADATKIKAGQRLQLPHLSMFKKTKRAIYKPLVKLPLVVGQVIKTRGKVFSISAKKKKMNLKVGSDIFVGDRIYTGVKGYIRLNMIDEAKIDLRCNSEMLIEDYQLLKGANRSIIHLLKGSVRKITGSIGKMADDIYEMHTPLATVGVRGTEYAIRVLQQYGCDGSLDVNSKGLFVKVSRGSIKVKTHYEKKVLHKGEAALLKDKNSRLKKIKVKAGVFEKPVVKDEKRVLFGAFYWLIFLSPIIILMRKI